MFNGIDAVIDKDLASLCLAREIAVDIFLIATDVEHVMIDFGTTRQRPLKRIHLEEAERYLKEGQFPEGSMGPKVQAAMEFVREGKRAVITSIETISKALEGKAGTAFIT